MKRKTIKYLDDNYFSYGDNIISVYDVKQFFIEQNHKADEVVIKFNLGSISGLYQILKHYNIKKPGDKRGELTTKGCLLKYGVKRASCLKEIKEKSKKTCLSRYGKEYVLQVPQVRDKIKNTNILKYNVDNPFKSSLIRDKYKQTCFERYGVDNYFKYEPFKRNLIRTRYYRSEVADTLLDKNKLINIILDIPKDQRTIRNIGIALGLTDTPIQYCDCVKYLSEYGLFDDPNMNIKPYIPNHSQKELEIKKFIEDLGFICESNRKILNGLEMDIFIPDKNIGIQFNGDYYHSSLKLKDRNYHYNKSRLAESKGIRLIHIYECEWNDPLTQQKIKSMLRIALGKVESKIYARKCEIRKISNNEAKYFNDSNHLQGHRNAQITYGLFYQDRLVQLMSFSHNRKYEWEIIRGCPASNNIVIGGVSKLFKHFIKENSPKEIFSYCDFNKFDGHGYEELGMEFLGYTGPDKFYVIKGRKVARNPKRVKELTEAASFIIYGAGSKKYLWRSN